MWVGARNKKFKSEQQTNHMFTCQLWRCLPLQESQEMPPKMIAFRPIATDSTDLCHGPMTSPVCRGRTAGSTAGAGVGVESLCVTRLRGEGG